MMRLTVSFWILLKQQGEPEFSGHGDEGDAFVNKEKDS